MNSTRWYGDLGFWKASKPRRCRSQTDETTISITDSTSLQDHTAEDQTEARPKQRWEIKLLFLREKKLRCRQERIGNLASAHRRWVWNRMLRVQQNKRGRGEESCILLTGNLCFCLGGHWKSGTMQTRTKNWPAPDNSVSSPQATHRASFFASPSLASFSQEASPNTSCLLSLSQADGDTYDAQSTRDTWKFVEKDAAIVVSPGAPVPK